MGFYKVVAYKFYVHDETQEFNLIGILPERRKELIRITQESILKWGKMVAGDDVDGNKIYFVRIQI